jgi:hypothetical protein
MLPLNLKMFRGKGVTEKGGEKASEPADRWSASASRIAKPREGGRVVRERHNTVAPWGNELGGHRKVTEVCLMNLTDRNPELDEEGKEFQDVDVDSGRVNMRLMVVASVVPIGGMGQPAMDEVVHRYAPHMIQMMER